MSMAVQMFSFVSGVQSSGNGWPGTEVEESVGENFRFVYISQIEIETQHVRSFDSKQCNSGTYIVDPTNEPLPSVASLQHPDCNVFDEQTRPTLAIPSTFVQGADWFR